jgi:predicted nucleic acid-binding protein
MILYLDTSALVKRYFKEPYSEDVINKWRSATQIATSFVTYAETMASIFRKRRESHLDNLIVQEIQDLFKQDWLSFVRVEVNDELNLYVDRVTEQYQLRGFDSIHLASALIIHHSFQQDFLFACFDDKLAAAARAEDVQTFP